MIDSILTSIKKLLGIEEDYEYFDQDILININTAIMTLAQLGVGPDVGYVCEDKTNTWQDFLGDFNDLQAVKTFIYLKTKLTFDPPGNSFLVESIKSQIDELTWRLNVRVEGREDNGN